MNKCPTLPPYTKALFLMVKDSPFRWLRRVHFSSLNFSSPLVTVFPLCVVGENTRELPLSQPVRVTLPDSFSSSSFPIGKREE